jgi:hypothetical protein
MPGGHLSLKPKRQGETCYGSSPFDFISVLAVGETIATQVVTASVYSGNDPSPSALISGAAAVQNVTQVIQLFTGGVVGVIYNLICTITTSLGQTLKQMAYLSIIPDAMT